MTESLTLQDRQRVLSKRPTTEYKLNLHPRIFLYEQTDLLRHPQEGERLSRRSPIHAPENSYYRHKKAPQSARLKILVADFLRLNRANQITKRINAGRVRIRGALLGLI